MADTTAVQTFYTGSHRTIGTTAVQLTTSSSPAHNGVLIKAANENTGTIFAGTAGVTAGDTAASDGMQLGPGESNSIPVNNGSAVYVIASGSPQVAYWQAS